MLILTCRIGDGIAIKGNIGVSILGSKNNQVRIGVNAPKEVVLQRQEKYLHAEQIKKVKNQVKNES
ncbi:MAG: csrA [Gammaproteobacteria bacterium]|jgi:carbon storage regulator|nr:csrA [Gammaproteobacteria bacterium]